MEQEIIKMVASQGPYAALFVALLFYVLRENARREDRLLKCLEVLGEKYDILDKRVESVDKRVERVESTVEEIKDDVKEVLRHA